MVEKVQSINWSFYLSIHNIQVFLKWTNHNHIMEARKYKNKLRKDKLATYLTGLAVHYYNNVKVYKIVSYEMKKLFKPTCLKTFPIFFYFWCNYRVLYSSHDSRSTTKPFLFFRTLLSSWADLSHLISQYKHYYLNAWKQTK